MNTHKVLVVALEQIDELPVKLRDDAEVRVVAPALNSCLRHWCSDDRAALQRAATTLGSWLLALDRAGIRARGRIGDANVVQAIEDEVARFAADEIVIPAELEGRVRARFAPATLLVAA